MLRLDKEIPDAEIGLLKGDEVETTSIANICRGKTVMIVGFPGVFTPVCQREHLPSIIENFESIIAQGINKIYCISDDNFWALNAFRKSIPNSQLLSFLCDGNREFLSRSQLPKGDENVFLGGKYPRFYAIVQDGKVIRMKVEKTVFSTDLTNGFRVTDDIYRMITEDDMKQADESPEEAAEPQTDETQSTESKPDQPKE